MPDHQLLFHSAASIVSINLFSSVLQVISLLLAMVGTGIALIALKWRVHVLFIHLFVLLLVAEHAVAGLLEHQLVKFLVVVELLLLCQCYTLPLGGRNGCSFLGILLFNESAHVIDGSLPGVGHG